MPDKRSHRGPHPEDANLFIPETLSVLRCAVDDMSWLLNHGYAEKSSLKLVGDRYKLKQRQRLAVLRSSCSDGQLENRNHKQIPPEKMHGNSILIDGYNLLITVEAALSGAVLFTGRDGCVRDLSGVHGTYRKVQETSVAIELVGTILKELSISGATWLLDSPVSNSGKLKEMILLIGKNEGFNWGVELLPNPDKTLIESADIIASSDSLVLDHCHNWLNLAALDVQAIQARQEIHLFDLRTY